MEYHALKIGNKTVWVELAFSHEKRMQGLMYRRSLEKDSGMLFIYPRAESLSFWMKNTFIPLSIAFIKKNGEILEIQDMSPTDGRPDFQLQTYRCSDVVVYALEMKQGWFEAHGIKAGDKVIFPLAVRGLLYWDDFKNLSSFLTKLQKRSDFVSQYLAEQLSPESQRILSSSDIRTLDPDLKAYIIDDLNQILFYQDIWENLSSSEQKKQISQELSTMTEINPTEKRIWGNRIFLKQNYPHEIRGVE